MSDPGRRRSPNGGASRRWPEGGVPLRPLTTGEVLDAAVAVLRMRPRRLVGVGVALAIIEQLLLFPLRTWADQDITMFPATGHLQQYAWLVLTGFGTEAAAIAVLGALAAIEVQRLLLGPAAPAARARFGSVATVAIIAGLVVAAAASPFLVVLDRLQTVGLTTAWLFSLIAWPIPYGLVGLAAAVVVIERRAALPALWRGMRLATRETGRVIAVRVLGYVGWALVRLALITATIAAVTLTHNLPSATWDRVALSVAAILVNSVAYPVLGCLDAMLLVETRMRTEGLDIAVRWARRRGVTPSLDALRSKKTPTDGPIPATIPGVAR